MSKTFYLPSESGWASTGAYANTYYLRMKVVQDYNVATNKSTLTVSLQAHGAAGVYSGVYYVQAGGTLSGGGNTLYTFVHPDMPRSHYVYIDATDTWRDLTSEYNPNSWSFTVTHNANGSVSVPFAFKGQLYAYLSGASRYGNFDVSATLSLSEARASTISAPDGTFGQALSITIDRKSSAYTHTITTSCLGVTETLLNKGSTYPTVTWTPALATYAPKLTTAMNTTATITCTTYYGDTAVGTNTITVTLSLAASDVKPTVTLAVEDPTGYATKYGGYVVTKSKLKVTLTPSLKYGAKVNTTVITANGSTYNSSPTTTEELISASYNTATGKITDSRGQSSATASKTITTLAYSAPAIKSFSVHRCDADGTDNGAGAYMRVTYNVAITSLNAKNSKALKVQYKKRGESSYTSRAVTLSAYTASGNVILAADTEYSYDVRLVLTDDFGTASALTQLSSAEVRPLNFRAGGRGIGVGKVSEREKALEIAADWKLYIGDVDVLSPSALAALGALGVVQTSYIPSTDDLNDYKTTGIYRISNTLPANAPSGVAWSVLVVLIVGTSYMQVIINGNAIWTRSGNTSAWYAWYKFSGTAV